MLNLRLNQNIQNQQVVHELQKALQRSYFIEKTIDQNTYEVRLKYYEKKEFKLKNNHDLLLKKISDNKKTFYNEKLLKLLGRKR